MVVSLAMLMARVLRMFLMVRLLPVMQWVMLLLKMSVVRVL